MTAVRKLSHQDHYLSLMPQAIEWSSLFESFGWAQLPQDLKSVINNDLLAFENEINGRYSYTDDGIKSRRRNVRFWVESFMNNEVSLDTAVKSLSIRF